MTDIKRRIVDYLRKTHLLQLADSVMLFTNIIRNRKTNKEFLASHPGFVPPPYHLAYDAYNHTSWQLYYDMGLRHSLLISELIKANISKNEIVICEWGCGPARVIRHLDKIEGFSKIKLYGTDYNEKSIAWCNQNIKNAHFFRNQLEPPLPFETEMFDCIYAISIFTHLSEKMHYAWIHELCRTLKPDGILIFTTHGDLCARKLLPADKALYDSGLFVSKDRIKEGKKHFSAFHPQEFMLDKLLKNHNIVKHIPNPTEYYLEQDVWVVKKK